MFLLALHRKKCSIFPVFKNWLSKDNLPHHFAKPKTGVFLDVGDMHCPLNTDLKKNHKH